MGRFTAECVKDWFSVALVIVVVVAETYCDWLGYIVFLPAFVLTVYGRIVIEEKRKKDAWPTPRMDVGNSKVRKLPSREEWISPVSRMPGSVERRVRVRTMTGDERDATWVNGIFMVDSDGVAKMAFEPLEIESWKPARDRMGGGLLLSREFDELTEAQKHYFVQHLCGGFDMVATGFNEGSHDDEGAGRWALDSVKQAMAATKANA